MRGRCLLFALLLIPMSTAQSLPERLLGQDGEDDVELILQDGTSLGFTDQFPHLDVLGAEVFKAASGDMTFQIALKDPSYAQRGDQDEDFETSIALHFHFGDIHYYVDYGDWRRDGGDACLTRYIDGDRIDPIQCFPTASSGQDIAVEIPGSQITDHAGAKLRHPAQLSQVWAEGRMDAIHDPVLQVQAIDVAPDEGTWGDLLTPADPGAGPLILTPIQPVRGSNGGPDLIVYHVLVDNIAEETIHATPAIEDLPNNWEATVPGRITVAPGTTYDLPVLVRIPGAHGHGETHEFTVTITTDEDAWTETLGLNFFEVPQPAGHHPRMYLHGNSPVDSWISTLADDEDAEGTPNGGWGAPRGDAAANTAKTLYYLDSRPDLFIGLDFDTTSDVLAQLRFNADFATNVELRIALEHCNPVDNGQRSYAEYGGDMRCPGSWIPLAEAAGPVELVAGTMELDWALPVTEYADLVPPQKGALLALMVELTQSYADGITSNVVLETDGTLDLPLFEYRDPLDGALASLADLSLHGDSELTIGSGSTAWRAWSVLNEGPARDLELSVFGHNAEWISIEPAVLRVPAGDAATFHVGIDVGNGFADVFILAVDQNDPSQNWAHPLRVESDSTMEATRDEPPPAMQRDSPGLAVALMALALLVVALRRPGRQ